MPEILRKGFKKIPRKDVFMKMKMLKNISDSLQKYFAKCYKETFQKDFLYHCLKCFSQVFGTFWTRFWHRENAFQEMLLQGFTSISRINVKTGGGNKLRHMTELATACMCKMSHIKRSDGRCVDPCHFCD